MTDPTNTTDLNSLRVDIARALGHQIVQRNGQYGYFYRDEHVGSKLWFKNRDRALRFMIAYGTIPNWPEDVGEALALCHDVFDKGQGDVAIGYEPTEPESIRYMAYLNKIYDSEIDWDNRHCYHCYHPLVAEGATAAESLARLALAALRGGAGGSGC